MTRPRDSLLSLFDPLVNAEPAATPGSRDSTDLSSSDKENSASRATGADVALTMTKFFDRTYNRPKDHKNPPKPLPNGILIDFDLSISMDDTDGLVSDEDSGMDAELEGTNTENSAPAVARNSPVTPRRRVLADITTEDDAAPLGLLDATPLGFKQFRQSAGSSSKSPSLAPALSPRVLHPVNLPSPMEALSSRSPPSIAVHSPTSDPCVLLPPQPISPSELQHNRRDSLDLHSSFNMNLRDTSFDLLNDRISFIGCDSMIGSDSMGDIEFDMKQGSRPASPPAGNVVSEDISDSGIESDKGGLADVESDTDPELVGPLVDRLTTVTLDEDSETESEIHMESTNLNCLVTPKPPTFSGPVPRAPHARRVFTTAELGNMAEPVAIPVPKPKVRERASLVPAALAPTAPIAALRIVKKAKASSHGRTDSASTVFSNLEVAPRKSSPPSSSSSRVPSPAEAPSSSKAPAAPLSRLQKTSSAPRPSLAEPPVRLSKASIIQYGPSGRAAAIAAKRGVVERPPSSSASRASVATATNVVYGLKRSTTAGVTSYVRPPAVPKASGIRPPSCFGTPSAVAPSTTTTHIRDVTASKVTAPSGRVAQSTRDVARILRGPERPKSVIKRV